jgi:hypothetical protein
MGFLSIRLGGQLALRPNFPYGGRITEMGNDNQQIPPVAGTMLEIREHHCQAPQTTFEAKGPRRATTLTHSPCEQT